MDNIGKLFDSISGSYDRLNHLFSLNIDRRWRRNAVRSLTPCQTILDVAIGTADLTLEILAQDKARHVTGIDLSEKMMAIGQEKVSQKGLSDRVTFHLANAQQMPFDDGQFDAVTCAYGVRNFADMDQGLREMYRVLKTSSEDNSAQPADSSGTLLILEFSYPTNRLVRRLYDFYFSQIMPAIGNRLSKNNGAYTYLNRSVKSFPQGEDFCRHLQAAGFTNISYRPLTFGITTVYKAEKHTNNNNQ